MEPMLASGGAIPPTFDEGAESIYWGNVPVVMKFPEREDRQTTLTVAMSYTTGQPRNQRVLHVQLTDEGDAALLYNLDISEDDFHLLKTEQSILVDFPTFPSKFIELLRQCQAAAGEEHREGYYCSSCACIFAHQRMIKQIDELAMS